MAGDSWRKRKVNMAGHGTGGPSIILDPQKMFNTLQELERHTKGFIREIHEISECLQQVSHLTYAIGFGVLIKQAEADINQVGNAVVAANNTVNTACKDVVNELVKKFATQGAKSDYSSPPFEHIHLKVNPADRAAIYPQTMVSIFMDFYGNKILEYEAAAGLVILNVYETQNFWIGISADKMRNTFLTKVTPEFENLSIVLKKICKHGMEWIDETMNFEASLPTP
jgi:hypothetical protein